MKRAAECGICGVIVPDVPYEEKEDLAGACKKYDVELVSLITPTSHERIQMIVKRSRRLPVLCIISWSYRGAQRNYNEHRGND